MPVVLLEVEKLRHVYGEHEVIAGLSFALERARSAACSA